MRMGAGLAILVLCLLAIPSNAAAQCGVFLAGSTCSHATATTIHADFGSQKAAQKPARQTAVNPPKTSVSHDRNAIDCQMIKPVDPGFRSAMPMLRRDPTVQLPMRTVQPPSCKR